MKAAYYLALAKVKPRFQVVVSRHRSESATAQLDSKVLLKHNVIFVVAARVSEEELPSLWGWGPGWASPRMRRGDEMCLGMGSTLGGYDPRRPLPRMRRGHGVYVDRSVKAGVARLWHADLAGWTR